MGGVHVCARERGTGGPLVAVGSRLYSQIQAALMLVCRSTHLPGQRAADHDEHRLALAVVHGHN